MLEENRFRVKVLARRIVGAGCGQLEERPTADPAEMLELVTA